MPLTWLLARSELRVNLSPWGALSSLGRSGLGHKNLAPPFRRTHCPEPAAPNLSATPPPGKVLTTTQISYVILWPPTLLKTRWKRNFGPW